MGFMCNERGGKESYLAKRQRERVRECVFVRGRASEEREIASVQRSSD